MLLAVVSSAMKLTVSRGDVCPSVELTVEVNNFCFVRRQAHTMDENYFKQNSRDQWVCAHPVAPELILKERKAWEMGRGVSRAWLVLMVLDHGSACCMFSLSAHQAHRLISLASEAGCRAGPVG